MPNDDWYPTDAATERLMYGNIDLKIDGFKAKYPFLTGEVLDSVHRMCKTFIEGYDKVEFNRAAAKAMTIWFQNLIGSRQKNEAVQAPPVFQGFNVPAGATAGLEEQCRAFRRLMVGQSNYDKADGLDLMIEKGEHSGLNPDEAQPVLKVSVALDGTVSVEWKKVGFDSLELQYRKAGTEMWQLADKSTERIIEFKPMLLTPDTPEKFELRGVYILKNKRVGQWSDISALTVG